MFVCMCISGRVFTRACVYLCVVCVRRVCMYCVVCVYERGWGVFEQQNLVGEGHDPVFNCFAQIQTIFKSGI